MYVSYAAFLFWPSIFTMLCSHISFVILLYIIYANNPALRNHIPLWNFEKIEMSLMRPKMTETS